MVDSGDSPDGGGQRGRDSLRSHLRHAGLGTQLALLMLIGVLGGNWLDEKTGWDPLFLLLGTAFGIASGIWAVQKENRSKGS